MRVLGAFGGFKNLRCAHDLVLLDSSASSFVADVVVVSSSFHALSSSFRVRVFVVRSFPCIDGFSPAVVVDDAFVVFDDAFVVSFVLFLQMRNHVTERCGL